MNRFWVLSLPLLVALTALSGTSCGSSAGRQLQSISISKTASGTQVQFIAAGTFSSAPMTVTPLPVDWTIGLMAPPPPQYSYTLTTQPFTVTCSGSSSPAGPIVAFAPPDPNAPASGSVTKVIAASIVITCP